MNSTKYAILTDVIEKAEIQLLTNLKTDLKEKGELQISYDGEPVDFAYLDDDNEKNVVTIDKIKQDGMVDGISKRFYEILKNKKYIKEFYDECNRTPKNELNDRLKQIDTWLQQYPGEN